MLRRLLTPAAILAALLLPAPADAIVNGTAPTRDYPFMAALELDDSQYCGSSLVAPQWILTAAHCVDGVTPDRLTFQIGGVEYVGSPLDFYSQNDMGERIAATQVIVHEGYEDPEQSSNDIALVKLARPSTYPPIPIADPATQKALWAPGVTATVMGYGAPFYYTTSPTGDFQEAKVPMVADEDCSFTYNDVGFGFTGVFEPATMVCAGNEYGTEDSCQGDSGGPLVVEDGAGGLVQVGVVSWGFACGLPAFYGVYGRVGDTPLNSWIQARIGGGSGGTLSAPASADLGTVERGKVGASTPVTVTNGSDGEKTLGAVSVAGPDASAVSVLSDGCSGATLGAGASCTISLALTPIHAGAQAATLRVGGDTPLATALTGVGTDPAPVVGPQGPAGPKGDAGPTGPRGPAGRDAQVTCKIADNKKDVECLVTYATTAQASRVSARVSRAGRTYARAKSRAAKRKGALKLRTLRRMRPGRYTLTLTVVDRQGRRSHLKRALVVN